MTDPRTLARAEVVICHHVQLGPGQGCLCGWAELGRSHARHVIDQLDQAGIELTAVA